MRPGAMLAMTVLLPTACGLFTGLSEEPGAEQTAEITLEVGEERSIPGTVLRIELLGVAEDSRCPVDVTCVWEGDAAVELGLTAGSGPTHLHVLHTALEPKAVDFNGVRVTLIGVAPEPREGEPIPADPYVVTLLLERLER
jgi:hypothetical protein